MSLQFYTDLPVISKFEGICDLSNYQSIPDNWLVVVSDVVDSRKAIEKGQYKSVNTVGAAGIVAVINALETNDIPYVFGGDGASLCIPPEFLEPVKEAMLGTKRMALNAFDLELRVGAVPVQQLKKMGGSIYVSKIQVCDWYAQAVFAGGGLSLAADLLKANPDIYHFVETPTAVADFSGLECRWNRVVQAEKSVLSILIKASGNSSENLEVYRSIIATINSIIHSEHPVTESGLSFSWNPGWLKNEYKTRSFFSSTWDKIQYFIDLYYRIFLGIVLMKFNIKIGTFNWGRYKPNLVASSDYKKFDDMLRTVISCTSKEKLDLLEYLNSLESNGEILYGLHESEAALVTCIIKEYSGVHFHFIDGDNGGYAMAATHLGVKEKNYTSG